MNLTRLVRGRMAIPTDRDSIKPWHMMLAPRMMRRSGMVTIPHQDWKASLHAAQSKLADPRGVWVFGYGSLMWNPLVKFDRRELVTVKGYGRRFCLTVAWGRGSVENPGLMLALDPEQGVRCTAYAYHIPADDLKLDLTILWLREMMTGAYQARYVTCFDGDDRPQFRALTFTANPGHERYEGNVAFDDQARRMATATGPMGDIFHYLDNLNNALAAEKIEDAYVTALHEKALALRS